jgi:HK97 family phage portal protein
VDDHDMSLTRRLLEKRMTLSELDTLMDRAVSGQPTASGADVGADSAMGLMAVWDAVRILAETIGSLPAFVMRRLEKGSTPALDHWLYPLIHVRANPEQTALEWRETMMVHRLLWGNAYAEKQRDGGGRVTALWPLHPDRVRPLRLPDQSLGYEVRLPKGAGAVTLRGDQVLHLRGLSANAVTGVNPLQLAREMLGLSLALQESSGRFFGNGAYAGGVIETDKHLSKEAYKRLEESINLKHAGLSNIHRTAILEEGLKWHQTTVDPEKAQSLESRRFQVLEVARWLNLPPHFLKDLERATFSNIEEQAIEFVVYCIRPHVVRWEQRLLLDLVPQEEWGKTFIKFKVEGLLRGDIKSRYDAYAVGRQWGWLSADEIRELEDMNPMPHGQGEAYWQPVNVIPVGKTGALGTDFKSVPEIAEEAARRALAAIRPPALPPTPAAPVGPSGPTSLIVQPSAELCEALRAMAAPGPPMNVVVEREARRPILKGLKLKRDPVTNLIAGFDVVREDVPDNGHREPNGRADRDTVRR